ncbi:MAG: hypothetical protein HY600_05600 [Candidatus Omnitrophica bacterium]|nr:hypothetical protein [Candidatus Omnitrophota bacterium]
MRIQLVAVGGGVYEARQLTCETCGERDHYTLDLIARGGLPQTARGRFRWVKGTVETEADVHSIQDEALIRVCEYQKLLLKTARYVGLISEEEHRRELAEVEALLTRLKASDVEPV